MFFIICIGFPAPLIAIHLLWVNLITDSLPAIALGMDPKDPNIMKEKPRDPSEGIFANGGFRNTVMYGAFITVAVLFAYFACGWVELAELGQSFSFSAVRELFNSNAEVLHKAQTMAFTTLALSELFHMLGMSNLKRSFVNIFKNKNTMMLVAFIAGFVLQLIVITVPGVNDIFSTAWLNVSEWIITAALSLIPIIAHELIVLGHKIFKKD
jgi:Ca2+-transporting ATPase